MKESAQGGSRTHKTTALNRVPIPVRLLGHKVEWLILGIPHLNTIISIPYPARYLQIRITILTTLLPPLAVFPQGEQYPCTPRGSRTLKTRILSPVYIPFLLPGHMAGVAGFEPTRAVLETARLPLSYTPIKYKTCFS